MPDFRAWLATTRHKSKQLLTDPDIAVRVHIYAFGVWVVLAVPSVLWWRSSILWVIFLSLYAIWVSHLSAVQAALADRRIKHGEQNKQGSLMTNEAMSGFGFSVPERGLTLNIPEHQPGDWTVIWIAPKKRRRWWRFWDRGQTYVIR
jgi:hypothetical protein